MLLLIIATMLLVKLLGGNFPVLNACGNSVPLHWTYRVEVRREYKRKQRGALLRYFPAVECFAVSVALEYDNIKPLLPRETWVRRA